MLDPTLYISITISLGMIIKPLSITYKKIHVIDSSITSFFLFSFLRSNPIQYPPIQFSHTLLTLLSLSLILSSQPFDSLGNLDDSCGLTHSLCLSFRLFEKARGSQARAYATILRQKTQRFSCAAILITPFVCWEKKEKGESE